MAATVRSYSKINLGLAIGPPRADGFHGLATLYQTLALHDLVTVRAETADETRIRITSNDPRVPTGPRNTVWKMVEKTLAHLGMTAAVDLHIQKNLPIQGGMGAGSANAAAALIGLERELSLELGAEVEFDLAAQVGSDVPLFLIGGSVLGSDRGQRVAAVPGVTLAGQTEIPCVIALPNIGVSTPQAFRDWDRQFEASDAKVAAPHLHKLPIRDTLEQLSRTFASVFHLEADCRSGASGIFPDPSSADKQNSPENLQGLSREQRHSSLVSFKGQDESGIEDDLAENSLLALVRTGIENDFETVVFPQYPLLRDIKRQLMGTSATENGSTADAPGHNGQAIYAALSGSGSALFGLYRTQTDAGAAQHRLQQQGVRAIVTTTIARPRYWTTMFAE